MRIIKIIISSIIAALILILSFIVYHQSYVIKTDNDILNAMKLLKPGMSVIEIEVALNRKFSDLIYDNLDSKNKNDKFISTLYMGMITSRNLVLIFDENKRLTFYSWENTWK